MDKKTLKILIASIAGVLVLAAAIILLIWKVWLPAAEKHKKDSSDGSQVSTSDTDSSQPSKDSDTENTVSKTDAGNSESGTKSSEGGTGDTSSVGGTAASTKPIPTDITFSVEDITTKKGAVIKVPVKIEKNPGIAAGKLQFEYDTDSLEYLGYEAGLFLPKEDTTEGKTISIIVLNENDVTEDGTILYLKFTVKNTAAASSTIKVSYDEVVGIGNYNEEMLVPKSFVNGTVTVK